jgi:hypothetical protein
MHLPPHGERMNSVSYSDAPGQDRQLLLARVLLPFSLRGFLYPLYYLSGGDIPFPSEAIQDQGVQFAAQALTGHLEDAGIRVSMDGRGRTPDNSFIERLWRSLKYEGIYLRDHATVPDLEAGLQCVASDGNGHRM